MGGVCKAVGHGVGGLERGMMQLLNPPRVSQMPRKGLLMLSQRKVRESFVRALAIRAHPFRKGPAKHLR